MNTDGACRLQVCGPLRVCVHGDEVTSRIPPGQARILLVYLALNRGVQLSRVQLIQSLWPVRAPEHAARDVSALLSRLRTVLGHDVLPLGGATEFVLPPHAVIDIEEAAAALARAESAVAIADWPTAWAAGRTVLAIARRGFLPDVDLPWVEQERDRLRDLLLRGFDAVGEAGLGLGGPEVLTTRRMASEIIAEEPLRESAYRLAMRAAIARGDDAEAIQVYARLRARLADELGVDPGPRSRALFEDLLARSTRAPSV